MSYLDLSVDERGRLIERQRTGWRTPDTAEARAADKPRARERYMRQKLKGASKERVICPGGFVPDSPARASGPGSANRIAMEQPRTLENLKAAAAADAARALDPLSRAHDAFAAARDEFFRCIEAYGEADARTERAGDEMMRLRGAFLKAWSASDAA